MDADRADAFPGENDATKHATGKRRTAMIHALQHSMRRYMWTLIFSNSSAENLVEQTLRKDYRSVFADLHGRLHQYPIAMRRTIFHEFQCAASHGFPPMQWPGLLLLINSDCRFPVGIIPFFVTVFLRQGKVNKICRKRSVVILMSAARTKRRLLQTSCRPFQ